MATTAAQDAELPGDRRVNHAYAIPRSSCSCPSFCWDNAVAERFFLNLKMERVWQRNYANHA